MSRIFNYNCRLAHCLDKEVLSILGRVLKQQKMKCRVEVGRSEN